MLQSPNPIPNNAFQLYSWTEPAVVMIPLNIEGASQFVVRHRQMFEMCHEIFKFLNRFGNGVNKRFTIVQFALVEVDIVNRRFSCVQIAKFMCPNSNTLFIVWHGY